MTGNDYRDLKIGELRAEVEKLNDIALSTYSPETKQRMLRNVDRRVRDLTGLLTSPALAAVCDPRKDDGNPAGHREATAMDFW
jgi:hypothetical protein